MLKIPKLFGHFQEVPELRWLTQVLQNDCNLHAKLCLMVGMASVWPLPLLVVGRLIVNSIARLALGRVPINRTCRPSLDLCRAIIKINTTRRPPSWKVRAIGRIHCNSLLEWITVYNLTEPAELVSYKVYMILFYSMHYIDTLFQVEIDA